jgi:hypothetical protein
MIYIPTNQLITSKTSDSDSAADTYRKAKSIVLVHLFCTEKRGARFLGAQKEPQEGLAVAAISLAALD